MAVAHCGLTPAFFQTVVAVLQPESASIDGINHLLRRASGPATEFAWRLWDISNATGAEVIDYHGCVLVARPDAAWRTLIDAIDTVGVVTMVAHVTTKHFRTELEPTFGLPTQSGDGTGVETGIQIGVGVFVFELFADENGQLCRCLGNEARKHHVGQVVVADHIGVAVVGDTTTQGVRDSLGRDVLSHVGAMVTQQADGYRGNLPCVVGTVEPSLHVVGGGGGHLVEAIHFCDDALAGAVVLQLVGILGPSVVVRCDDEVLGTFVVVAQPLLHTGFIVNDGQLVVVEQLGSEDGIPIG